jgi:hypothetical protein
VQLLSVSTVMPCVRVDAMMFLLMWNAGLLSERSRAGEGAWLVVDSFGRRSGNATEAE